MSNDVWLVNTTYSCNCHPELMSVSCGLNPSPAFQAPSAQGRQGHTHRIALRFPLSSTRGEGKEECVGNMNQNIFNDTDFSLFTFHLKLLFIPHQAHEHYNEHRHILSSHHLHLLGIFF